MYGEESDICRQAVEVYGNDMQLMMLMEEAGELFQAISKHKRGFGDLSNIAEEIVDLEIMLEQAKYIYGCHSECRKWKNKKINRLAGRIEEQKRQ